MITEERYDYGGLYKEDVYEKLKGTPIETHYISTMDLELGVRYAFPLKK